MKGVSLIELEITTVVRDKKTKNNSMMRNWSLFTANQLLSTPSVYLSHLLF